MVKMPHYGAAAHVSLLHVQCHHLAAWNGHGGSIYTTEIGKCDKQSLFVSALCWFVSPLRKVIVKPLSTAHTPQVAET